MSGNVVIDKAVRTTKSPKSPMKKKINNILKINPSDVEVNIPSLEDDKKMESLEEILEIPEIVDENLEAELFAYGYIPKNKIVIKNTEGEYTSVYVKAVNRMGQIVYILLDTDNNPNNIGSDLTLIESKTGNILPYSLKLGAIKMAGMNVSGVAFECDKNGLCVLSNRITDNNIQAVEYNFTFVEEKTPAATVVENYGCNMSYPVVKLSEIKANNNLVTEGSNIVTRKLRNASYNAYEQDLCSLKESIITLNQKFDTFTQIYQSYKHKLSDTLTLLEQWNAHYICHPPQNECDKKKAELIFQNITTRNNYINYLICGMKRVAENKNQVDKISENVDEFNNLFIEIFSNLDKSINS